MNRDVSKMRRDYTAGSLDETSVDGNPIVQFKGWFDEALQSSVIEPNAMVLSTSNDNKPSARVVLLKGFDESGFTFFTNYDSRKGNDIASNPFAALTFFWDALERQVRIEGKVRKVDAQASDEYFNSRPRESRIGAAASPQSHKVANREVLENKVEAIKEQFPDAIPRPNNWGGYIVEPARIEFWQGRTSRLHDRIVYEHDGSKWQIYRVAP